MQLNEYGVYTVTEILDKCGINLGEVKDYRRVRIGGVGFDYPEDKIRVVGSELVVTLDEQPHTTFSLVSGQSAPQPEAVEQPTPTQE